MVTKCIGIISYLPDDSSIRQTRLLKLQELLYSLYRFNLPIIIISQNYKDTDYIQNSKITYYSFEKLGIVGARNKLRQIFLDNTTYDYLIMIDDDCKVNISTTTNYLKQIDLHPSGFGEFKLSLLKLFAISRDLLSEVSFDENCNPEKGEGFEDRLFVNTLRKKFPDKRYQFVNTGITEISISTDDPNTTWYKKQDLTKMLNNTQKKIDNIC